jgi:tetraacyldisaccharide 4'-kinase
MIGADETKAAAQLPPGLPVLRARLVPDCVERLGRRPVIAFAGIGRPQKFFRSVLALGADIVATKAFADHHVFSARDCADLLNDAANAGATLVTTPKDYVRLPGPLRAMTIVVSVRLEWEDEAALNELLVWPKTKL